MTKFFRGAILSAIALGLMLSQSNIAQAQSVKDRAAVVVRIKSIDNLLDSVAYMVGAAGFRNFVPAITLGAGAFLEGFDTERPIGGYLTLDDGVPQFVGFIPVEDLGDVIDMLENNGVEIEEDGDDFIIISPTGDEIVIRGKGKWAFISANAEMLEDLPEDPAKLVSDIGDEYGVAVKAYVQRIPAALRSQAIELMEQAFDETYENLPGPAAEFQRRMNENSLNQLAGMIQQSDEIFLGLAADKKGKRLYADFSFTGQKGSDLAKGLTAGKGAKTDFSSFLKMDEAALTFNAASKVSGADAENAKGTFGVIKDELGNMLAEDANLSEEDADLLESFVGDMLDVVMATIDSGKMDMGGAVLLGEEGLNVVGAGHLADAKKLEAAVKKLVDAKGDQLPPVVDLELDAEKYKGVTFHKLSGSIPEDEAQSILGETTTLAVGISSDKVYVGFGVDPIAKLKKAIDGKSSKVADPMTQVNLKLSPILRMVAQINGDDMFAEMADKLEDEGNQSLRIIGSTIENGQKTRLELEDGILGLIQVGASGFGGGGFGGGDF